MPFPGIAFAVSPAPESGTENTQIVESDSTPAETSGGTQAAAPDSAPAETSDGTQAEATDTETLPLLIIVAGFSNVSYRDDFDWAEAIFNGDESLAAYYDDMSLGQFTFVPMNETCSHESGDTTNKADKANDGIVHVTLELEHFDWTVPGSEIFMSTFGSALLEMIKAADRFVDFASYDTNHNGELSSDEAALGFVIAGYEAAVTRDYSQYGADKYLWSHDFWLDELLKDKYPNASYYRPDGVLLSPYIAISEQERTDMQSSIGTLAHELGHYLGLPDLYDVVYADDNPWSQYSTSFLCLMDAGSSGYTEDGRSIPTALSAACRYLLGWLDSIIVTYSESLLISPQDFSAPPNNSGYVVAKIPIDGRDDEFYLVENRRYSGWDEALKPYYGSSNPNGGLVFWHIDMSIFDKDPENVNGTDHHQAIMPLFIEKKQMATSPS